MTKVPTLEYKKVVRALQRDGWVVVRQKGSHIRLQKHLLDETYCKKYDYISAHSKTMSKARKVKYCLTRHWESIKLLMRLSIVVILHISLFHSTLICTLLLTLMIIGYYGSFVYFRPYIVPLLNVLQLSFLSVLIMLSCLLLLSAGIAEHRPENVSDIVDWIYWLHDSSFWVAIGVALGAGIGSRLNQNKKNEKDEPG